MRNSDSNTLNRRRLFAGAGAIGAAAAVATVASKVVAPTEAAPTADKPTQGGGYRLSEHIKHYYQTTRV
jgi:nitrous oxide reductase